MGMLQVVFSGEGKLFGKSFPSPEPPSFQKLLKKTQKTAYMLSNNFDLTVAKPFFEVF